MQDFTFLCRVTFARVDNFARPLFCTSVIFARRLSFSLRYFCKGWKKIFFKTSTSFFFAITFTPNPYPWSVNWLLSFFSIYFLFSCFFPNDSYYKYMYITSLIVSPLTLTFSHYFFAFLFNIFRLFISFVIFFKFYHKLFSLVVNFFLFFFLLIFILS